MLATVVGPHEDAVRDPGKAIQANVVSEQFNDILPKSVPYSWVVVAPLKIDCYSFGCCSVLSHCGIVLTERARERFDDFVLIAIESEPWATLERIIQFRRSRVPDLCSGEQRLRVLVEITVFV